jgi:hypothetical protein
MFTPYSNLIRRIAITFKSIDDWGKLVFKHQLTRAEL